MKRSILTFSLLGLAWALAAPAAPAFDRPWTVAAASSHPPAEQPSDKKLSPEEIMEQRFPQPIRVGDLIGRPMIDWSDRTIGYVRQVVRTSSGKIQLIVPYRSWFGWISYGGAFAWGQRPVAVPLEAVAMLGWYVAALDMGRDAFDAAPTFVSAQAAPISLDETIRIAIARR